MFTYRTGAYGEEEPVLRPGTIVLLYLAVCAFAAMVGLFGNPSCVPALLALPVLCLLPAAIAAGTVGFLLCRPRVWNYLLPVLAGGVAWLCGGGIAFALLAASFFPAAFFLICCLRRRASVLVTTGLVGLWFLLLAAVVLGVFSFRATGDATPAGILAFCRDARDAFLTSAKDTLDSVFAESGVAEFLAAQNIAPDEMVALLVSELESLWYLLPGISVSLMLIACYAGIRIAFALLRQVPKFTSALTSRRLIFPRFWAYAFVILWVLHVLPAWNLALWAAVQNLYLVMLPGLAWVGWMQIWATKRDATGRFRPLLLFVVIFTFVSMSNPVWFFTLTLPLLALNGVLVSVFSAKGRFRQ